MAAGAYAATATAAVTTLVQKPGLAGCVKDAFGGPGACAGGKALGGARSVVLSPDGANAYVAAEASSAVSVLDRAPDGTLTQKGGTGGCVAAPGAGFGLTAGSCAIGVGLANPAQVAMSPDGTSLYVASPQSDAVLVFDRGAGGALTQKAGLGGCVSDTGAGPCADGLGLNYVIAVTVSADGKSVYTAAADSDTIAVFDRAADGALTQKAGTAGCVSNTGAGPCIDGTTLDYVNGLAASSDGRSLYTISIDNAVSVLDRAEDGTLTPKPGIAGCVSLNTTGGACAAGRGLLYPRDVTVSGDGASVYTVSDFGGLAVFDRAADGALTQKPGGAGCLASGAAEGCAPATALAGAAGVTVTPDGTGVYVASVLPPKLISSGGAVVVFDRAPGGALTQKPGLAGCISDDGSGGTCVRGKALEGATSIAVSPDSLHAYVAASAVSAVAVFDHGPFVAPPPPPPAGPAPPPDTTKPMLRGLSLRPARFRALARGAAVVTRGGSRISYRLSEAADVRFTLQRVVSGRRAGGRCVAVRRSNRSAKRCDRYRLLTGAISGRATTGANAFRFSGRLRNRKLAVGRYRLRAVAKDAAGNRSRTNVARFTILGGR